MHEYSLTLNLLEIVEEEGKKNNAKKITKIKLKIGKFSGVEPLLISHSFEILKKGKKLFEDAILEIEREEPELRCTNCGKIFTSLDFPFICPECGNIYNEMIKGSDMIIERIEMEI
ncbi:MAG: hydrogenase maturation nickel metallochaperone HypA [candidate division WOR-3 bacterium]